MPSAVSEEERTANAAAASSAVPNDGVFPPTQNDGGGLPPAAGGPASVPSIAELLMYLHAQNVRMENMMQMMRHDRPEARGDRLANVRLDEKNFRNVPKFNNLRSSWKEWKRRLLGAIRECDVDFADFVETFERH